MTSMTLEQQMMMSQKTPPAAENKVPEGESPGSEETEETSTYVQRKGKGVHSSAPRVKKFHLLPDDFQDEEFLGLELLESLVSCMAPRTGRGKESEFRSHDVFSSRRDDIYLLLFLVVSSLIEKPPSE